MMSAMNDFGEIRTTTCDTSLTITTSTPNVDQSQRRRRSWFEKKNDLNFDIAVEKKTLGNISRKRKSEENVETLSLTHFTNPPKIEFGRGILGREKSRTLRIKNPHEYTQTVSVERFPYKKNFSIDQNVFEVEAESSILITIRWCPENEGNFREMILFQVDKSYRLQAFVIGTCEVPVQKKKAKGGLLGKKVKQPFSIVKTSNLANIAKSYTSDNKTKKRKSLEEHTAKKLLKVPKPSSEAEEKKEDLNLLASPLVVPHVKAEKEENPSKRGSGHRRSNTYKVPDLDISPIRSIPIPQVHTAEQELEVAGPDNVKIEIVEAADDDNLQQTPKSNINPFTSKKFVSPNSFLNDSLLSQKGIDQPPAHSTVLPTPERCLMKEVPKKFVSPNSFLKELNKTQENFTKNYGEEIPSPTSVLNESIPHEIMVKQLQYVKTNISIGKAENSQLKENKMNDICVKGQTFVAQNVSAAQDLRRETFITQKTGIEQDLRRETFVTQNSGSSQDLRRETFVTRSAVKTFDPSIGRRETFVPHDSSSNPFNVRRETFVTRSAVKTFDPSIGRRETFVPHDSSSNPFNVVPEGTSPRRTTFTVKGKSIPSPAVKPCKQSNVKKLTASDSLKIKAKWKRRSSEKISSVQVSGSCTKEDLNTESLNLSESEDRMLYVERKEVVTRIEDKDILPTPERLLRAFIRTPDKNRNFTGSQTECDIRSSKKSNFPDEHDEVHEEFIIKGSKTDQASSFQTTLDTPERKMAELAVHKPLYDISVIEEIEEDDSVLVQAYGKDVIEDEVNKPAENVKISGSSTVTKVRPLMLDNVSTQNNNDDILPTPERNIVTVLRSNERRADLKPNNLSGSLTVTKESFKVLTDDVQQTPERNLNTTSNIKGENHQSVGKISNGKQLFSPGNLSTSFGSPRRLPDSPLLNDITHKSSSTVVKERPSDALMEFTQKQVKVCLFDTDQEKVEENIQGLNDHRNTLCQTIPEEKNPQSASYTISVQSPEKHGHDQSQRSENISFPTTPNQLPTSPNPELSRRSTHVVENPKVLNLSHADRRRLFPPLSNNEAEEQIVQVNVEKQEQLKNDIDVENLSQFKDVEDKENIKPVPKEDEKKNSAGEKQDLYKISKPSKGSREDLCREEINNKKNKQEEIIKQNKDAIQGKRKGVQSSMCSNNRKPAPNRSQKVSKEVKTKPAVKGIAQSKLLLIKKSKTALPKHPMPFASKNMYYDERWMEKQERGFVHWLNFVLTPAAEYQTSNTKAKVDAGRLCIEKAVTTLRAPTKEVLSFRDYAASRRLNQLRRAACKLFQSESVIRIIHKLEEEIESTRLIIRKDRMVHADLGLKQSILDMLLSFNPLWLRIGIETVYGEVIPLQRNDDVLGLSRFIVTRLLGSPEIELQYAHPTVPHLYKDGYAAAIARHMLKKFLLLIYFLDQAKSKRLINHDPCLFCKDAEYKNCKAMLIEFSRCYLAGEGDVTRHLGYLGYTVNHTQVPLDEFDYAVNNLATDLRDGVRLTRVIQFLSSKVGLTKKLRYPAISRLQKVHNMEVVFSELKQHGIDLDKQNLSINPRDIVDGHREKTLRLLWSLILQFQVSVLLDEKQLREEIEILEKSLQVRKKLVALRRYEQGLKEKRRESSEPEIHTQNVVLGLVLKWCRVVCSYYDVKVENFTVSFGDGRALCYLLHHYHPSLLPQHLIHHRTMSSYHSEMEQLNTSSSENSLIDSPTPFAVSENPAIYEELLCNEKENFKVLYEKVSELGNIPLMVRSIDMSNTIPDEKVVVTYVSYLCARLLDIRHESRAARVIQLAWRKYYLRKTQANLKVKEKAASVIQKAVRSYLDKKTKAKKATAAIQIQTWWRKQIARKRFLLLKQEKINQKQNQAADIIKLHMIGWTKRRQYVRLRRAACHLQALARGWLVRQHQKKANHAASVIQTRYLSSKLTRETRKDYLETRKAITTIQKWYRAKVMERKVAREKAAITLQTWWRMTYRQRAYQKCRRNIILLQAKFRAHLCSKQYRAKRRAALILQERYRNILLVKKAKHEYTTIRMACIYLQRQWRKRREERKKLHEAAALKIQSMYRQYATRKQYHRQRNAIIKLQALVRCKIAKQRFVSLKSAIIRIQQQCRAFKAMQKCHTEYRCLKASAIVLQSLWRGKVCQGRYQKQREAAVVLQRRYREYQQRKLLKKTIEVQHTAACNIQRICRGFLVRKRQQARHLSAITIQKYFRMYSAKSKFLKQKSAIRVIQRKWKATLERILLTRRLLKEENAAITLQSYIRKYLIRKRYLSLRKSAIHLQSIVRMKSERKEFLKKKHAVRILQMHMKTVIKGTAVRRQFLIQKGAAITIQSFYRAYRLRQITAAVKIQSCVRRFFARRKYKALQHSVLVLQRRYRAMKMMQKFSIQYKGVKASAILLQAVWRGQLDRRKFLEKRRAVVTLQALYRGHVLRKKFIRMQESASLIQRLYRAVRVSRKVRWDYQQKLSAVVCIQAWWRGVTQRSIYRKTLGQITKVQSCVRQYLARREFLKTRNAALILQRRFRGNLIGKKCRNEYKTVRNSVIIIQKWYRLCHAQKKLKRINSAVKIQSYYRGYCVRRCFVKQKKAAIVIQKYVKGLVARKEFMKQKKAISVIAHRWRAVRKGATERKAILIQKQAAIKIQSFIRMYSERKQFRNMKMAVTALQSVVRMKNARKSFLIKLGAIDCLQRRLKACLEARRTRREYLIQRGAAITLQAFYRMVQARRTYCCTRRAVLRIQTAFRRYQAQRKFSLLKHVTLSLQRRYRQKVLAKNIREDFLVKKEAAIVLQKRFRGLIARKHYGIKKRAAVIIQARRKMVLSRRDFLRKRELVVLMQRTFRRKLVAAKCRQQHQAAVTIQANYKRYKARKNFMKTRRSVIKVQSVVRMHQARQLLQRKTIAAVCIQLWYRNIRSGKATRVWYMAQKKAAITIQKFYRGYRCKKNFTALRKSTIFVQKTIKMKQCKKNYLRIRQAVLVLQRRIRSIAETRSAHRNFLIMKGAAISLQACYRGYLQRQRYLHLRRSAVKIQSCVRQYRDRQKWQQLRMAATVLQRRYRAKRVCEEVRREYIEKKHAAITIQRAFRNVREVKLQRLAEQRAKVISQFTQAAKLSLAAIRVQRTYRKYRIWCEAKKRIHSVVLLQRWIRSRLVRMRYIKFRCSVVNLQRSAKTYLQRRVKAAKTIQSGYRRWKLRMAEKRKIQAALTLQAAWRGRQVRRQHKSQKLKVIRKKIEAANRSATEEKKLGNRTASALDYLLKYRHLSQILEALMHLDVATRLSPNCCLRMVEVNAVQVIYTLIRSCNRSQPHMEIIQYAVSILLNLAKYNKTVDAVFVEGSMETLIDLLQIYREKGLIFYRTCTLVGILGIDLQRRMVINSDKKFIEKIQSLHALVSKKNKIDETRMLRQARQQAAKSFNCTLPIHTPSKKIPKIRPDWILQRDKMHEINNAMQAIIFVMDNYNISPK